MSNKKLTLKEKIAYGFGDFGNGFTFDLGQAFLLKFYTDVAGILPAAAGAVFMFTKIFDAFVDIFAGAWIDRRGATKNGKYRPVMMIAAIMLSVSTVLIFWSPPGLSYGAKLAFAYGTYMFWGIWYSFTNIPYGSLSPAMTNDVADRTQLAAFRQAGSLGALLITGAVFMPIVLLFSNAEHGYLVAALSMSIIGALAIHYCYSNTTEYYVPPPGEKIPLKSLFNSVVQNKPLLILILQSICAIAAYNIKIAMLVYFCQYNLDNIKLVSIFNIVIIGCSILAITSIPFIVKKIGKKNATIIGFTVSAIADLINFALPTNIYTFLPLAVISFAAVSIPGGIIYAMVADAMDFGEWKTGKKAGATVYAAFNFSKKIAQSISGLAAGLGLALVGYIPNVAQTNEALWGIKGLFMAFPAVTLLLASALLWFFYELSDARCKEIAADLTARKAGV